MHTATSSFARCSSSMLEIIGNIIPTPPTALARRMGLANRAWAETLTWERYAQEQYQVYEQILTG